jgi:hypothetical protein
MASLFPRWSNLAFFASLGAIAAAGVSVLGGAAIWVRAPWHRDQFEPVEQPVQFDHRHHNQDDGIDCAFCHAPAWRSSTAGIPSTEVCVGCHNQIWNESPMLQPVRDSWFSGAPIPWRRVHRVPDFVYFDHSIHVNRGVGCVSCHGRVDQMATVYQVEPLTMQWCLSCHRAPERHLRPLDEITNMAFSPADPERVGHDVAAQLGVAPLTHCTACHR